MSNLGQAALGIVGGIIGFYVGGPAGAAYGFQLGLAVGTVVSPTQLPGTYGPKLTDNRTTTSQIGAPVIEVFGRDAVPGTVMWLGKLQEHSTTTSQGGKGGPEQNVTTYSYTQPIALGLARGPMSGILRIWENGKLVYDRRPQQDGETVEAFANRTALSDDYEYGGYVGEVLGVVFEPSGGFTLYLGTEDQMPDPTIELKEGVGNVPAFRGLMYIVFHDRKLREDQALRHPNFKFEIFDEGSITCEEIEFLSVQYLPPWDPVAVLDIRNQVIGDYIYSVPGIASPPTFPSLEAAKAALLALRPGMQDQIAWSDGPSGAGSANVERYPFEPGQDRESQMSVCFWYPTHTYTSINAVPFSAVCDGTHGTATGQWGIYTPLTPIRSSVLVTPTLISGPDNIFQCSPFIGEYYDVRVRITRIAQPPPDPCLIYPPAPLPGYCIIDGYYVQCGPWTDVTGIDSYFCMSNLSVSDNLITSHPVNPVIRFDSPENTEAFWLAAYADAVAAGRMPPGLVYGDDYPDFSTATYQRVARRCSITTGLISIADIVRRICNRCGLNDIDIDVSDLQDRYVNGYQLGRIMDGRSAIAPLRSVGFFDAVESGGVLKFPVRGKPSVRTLTEQDIGAYEFGSDCPPIVTTKQTQDVELPRQLFVQYRDPERDYETAEQPSPTRLITEAVNDVYVDVAVAISATQAAQCAEVLWADLWASRWSHAIAFDSAQYELEPTDCFVIPIDGRNERVRMISVDDSLVILRRPQLVRDDDGNYVSEAIAEAPQVPPQTITVYALTELFLLDIPPLRATDNDVGVYAAVRPQVSGATFSGAQLFVSFDAGTTFGASSSAIGVATTGTLDAPFAAGETTVWDDVTEIFLTLESGTLESHTDEEVFAGANVLAVGDNVRFEIVQFANAELIAPDQWKLSRLLRGRRGTEHNMGTNLADDLVVLMTGSGITRVSIANGYLGVPVVFKAVTLGTSYATGVDQTLTSTGEALRPFSPVSLTGERDTSGNLTITWIRRDRLGEELPDGSAIAMSDPPETYSIDILDGNSPASILRTLTSNTESVEYSAAEQSDDFGSPIPDEITFTVYQVSAVRGRGTGTTATI